MSSSILLAPLGSALAHHDTSEQSQGHVQVGRKATVEQEFGSFELKGTRGSYWTSTLKGAYAIAPKLELGLGIPFHVLSLDGFSTKAGLGDLDLEIKTELLGDLGFTLSEGLSAELPTGDHHRGIGSGHVELSPFVSGMKDLDGAILHGTVSALFSMGHHQEEPGEPESFNFVAPHADRELRYHLGALFPLGDGFKGNAVVGAATALKSEEPETDGTAIYGRPELLWLPTDELQVGVSGEVPFGGHRRFDWKGQLAVTCWL